MCTVLPLALDEGPRRRALGVSHIRLWCTRLHSYNAHVESVCTCLSEEKVPPHEGTALFLAALGGDRHPRCHGGDTRPPGKGADLETPTAESGCGRGPHPTATRLHLGAWPPPGAVLIRGPQCTFEHTVAMNVYYRRARDLWFEDKFPYYFNTLIMKPTYKVDRITLIEFVHFEIKCRQYGRSPRHLGMHFPSHTLRSLFPEEDFPFGACHTFALWFYFKTHMSPNGV